MGVRMGASPAGNEEVRDEPPFSPGKRGGLPCFPLSEAFDYGRENMATISSIGVMPANASFWKGHARETAPMTLSLM
jgi:hypothetical protein